MSEPGCEEGARPVPPRGSEPFSRVAPPLSLPMRHFALAALAFPLFAGGLALGAERLVGFGIESRFALGLVHVLTLGWVAMTILGAWTQMIPVHGEAPLAAPGALRAAWWLFAGGAVAFVAALWSGGDRYWLAGLSLLAGVCLYVPVLGLTAWRSRRRDWTALHFAAALGWLAALASAGVLMAVDRQRGTVFPDPEGGLIAHVHMALLGFAATTVYGAGYRLFPWVALQQAESRLAGRLSFFLLQAAVLGLSVDALWLGRRLMPLWACLAAASFACYLSQFRPMLGRRPALDPSLGFTLLALAGGVLWAGLGLGLAFGRFPDVAPARAAYVFAALVGCLTPVILGQVHKIAPFLVWLHVYGARQGTSPARVPGIADLSDARLAWLELAALAVSIPSGAAGFLRESEALVRLSGASLLLCALAYLLNTAVTLSHLLRPDGRCTLPSHGAGREAGQPGGI